MSNNQQQPFQPAMPQPAPPQGFYVPGQAPAPDTEPAQKKTWWKARPVIGGAGLLLGLTIGAAAGGGDTNTPAAASSTPTVTVSAPASDGQAPAPAVTVTAPAPAPKTVQVPGPVKTVTAPPPGPAVAIAEDGTWLVGKDIKPGTYRSTSDDTCYWARLKDTDGDLDSILANSNGGNQVVTIKKSDNAFESARCAPWTKVR